MMADAEPKSILEALCNCPVFSYKSFDNFNYNDEIMSHYPMIASTGSSFITDVNLRKNYNYVVMDMFQLTDENDSKKKYDLMMLRDPMPRDPNELIDF